LTAGAEDFILKPLKSNDVQRLRNCSNPAKPSKDADDARQCETLSSSSRRKMVPSDQIAKKATSEHRSQIARLAMARSRPAQHFSLSFKCKHINYHDT
jgi:two-component response regulator (ARR-A family)